MCALVLVFSFAPTSSAHFHARSTATIITKYQEKRILSMPHYRMSLALSKIVCVCVCVCVCSVHACDGVLTLGVCLYSDRLYANVDELYDTNPEEEDPYSYGNESIYDSICYYQAPVRGWDISVVYWCVQEAPPSAPTASEDY